MNIQDKIKFTDGPREQVWIFRGNSYTLKITQHILPNACSIVITKDDEELPLARVFGVNNYANALVIAGAITLGQFDKLNDDGYFCFSSERECDELCEVYMAEVLEG